VRINKPHKDFYLMACDMREYVERVRTSLKESSAQTREQLLSWAEWAKLQADELDPIVSGCFQIDELPE